VGLPGSDFNPKGKSTAEKMRFCQSFMTELANYIGPHRDTPCAGVGVHREEIGYMFGQYKRIRQHGIGTEGVISSGYFTHPEVTGWGVAHFANQVLQARDESFEGKRVVISGSGTVALHTASKLLDLGAVPVAFSDTSGFIVQDQGFDREHLAALMQIKSEPGARVGAYCMHSTSARFIPTDGNQSIWDIPCHYALPCAVQNDIDENAVKTLARNGCKGIFEGANMGVRHTALKTIKQNKLAFAPGKAANSGPLALVGNEKYSRSKKLSPEELDDLLKTYMEEKYLTVSSTAEYYGVPGNLYSGSNIAGFLRVADAMQTQGSV